MKTSIKNIFTGYLVYSLKKERMIKVVYFTIVTYIFFVIILIMGKGLN